MKQRSEIYAFVSMAEFVEKGWEAVVRVGRSAGLSIRKIHENFLQSIGKDVSKMGQKPDWSVFFPKYRSPQKLITYTNSENLTKDKHPAHSLECAKINKEIEK